MIADRDSDLDAFGSVDRCVVAPVPMQIQALKEPGT
jgi:hypothetical protein